MAAASYDQLLKQVEALKMENSNLRQELEDNSNHLTKLETEASNMKVLQTLCLCTSAFVLLTFLSWTDSCSTSFVCFLDSYRIPFPSCVRENNWIYLVKILFENWNISILFFRNSFVFSKLLFWWVLISTTVLVWLYFSARSPVWWHSLTKQVLFSSWKHGREWRFSVF